MKITNFPPKKRAFFVYFWVSPFVSPEPFLAFDLFNLSFLLVFLCLLSFGSLFFSLSFFFCLLCFCFMKTNNINRFNCKVVFHQSCVFFGFLSCFLFQIGGLIPFSYLCFLPGIQLCFLFNITVFGLKKHKLKNTNFWSKGELQQNGLFKYNLCFAKCEKLSFFCPFFGQSLVDVQKNTIKISISAHFQSKKRTNMTILKGYYLGQVRVIIWAKFVAT